MHTRNYCTQKLSFRALICAYLHRTYVRRCIICVCIVTIIIVIVFSLAQAFHSNPVLYVPWVHMARTHALYALTHAYDDEVAGAFKGSTLGKMRNFERTSFCAHPKLPEGGRGSLLSVDVSNLESLVAAARAAAQVFGVFSQLRSCSGLQPGENGKNSFLSA